VRARLLIVLAAVTTAACGPKAAETPVVADAKAVTFVESAWTPLREADIPNDSMGASIKRGLYLLRFSPESLPAYATGSLRCTSCHQDDGLKLTAAPLTGSHARFPKYMPRSGAVIALADRVNYCFTRSLAGNALPVESREMTDILVVPGVHLEGHPGGHQDRGRRRVDLRCRTRSRATLARGEALYTSKTVHHLPWRDGGRATVPCRRSGARSSYSVGASMTRLERAASFIRHNMPQTAPGTLTAQEAFDLSAYINSQPRPDSPGKELDWPMGGAPSDVPYDTKGHKAFQSAAR
jgi:thiosulfate dehydrogenase